MKYEMKTLSDYSEENILNELKRVAKLLNKNTVGYEDMGKHGRCSTSVYEKKFGSWNNALLKAGLEISHRQNIPSGELLAEMETLWNKLGKQPTYDEMDELGRFSTQAYVTRFGSWRKALAEFVRRKNEGQTDKHEPTEELNPEALSTLPQTAAILTSDLRAEEVSPDVLSALPQKPRRAGKAEYGEPIDFRGLRHAPLNEQGVVYLFGVVSRELGFIIESVRTGFPDCEGKRKVPGKEGRWERVNIEFEYKSSHFKEHKHNADECDLIVCWEDDWKESPLEVLSLKERMKKLEK